MKAVDSPVCKLVSEFMKEKGLSLGEVDLVDYDLEGELAKRQVPETGKQKWNDANRKKKRKKGEADGGGDADGNEGKEVVPSTSN